MRLSVVTAHYIKTHKRCLGVRNQREQVFTRRLARTTFGIKYFDGLVVCVAGL